MKDNPATTKAKRKARRGNLAVRGKFACQGEMCESEEDAVSYATYISKEVMTESDGACL
jgi:hypothetical protein